jgi:hypothetical protein
MQRNITVSQNLSVILYALFEDNGKFLDFAGGYGILTRLMRDIGFDFYWADAYSENLVARGFEGGGGKWGQYYAVTSFESFEHFLNPIQEIEKLAEISKTIIFTTELLPNPVPKPDDWWYYSTSSGQHICFYSQQTLQIIAQKLNLNYILFHNLHIFCEEENIKKLKMYLQDTESIKELMQKNLYSKTFNDHLKISGTLPKIPKERELFLWGTGRDAAKTLGLVKYSGCKVTAFVDSNKGKETKFSDYDVILPKDLFEKNTSSYFVIIASTKYASEIASELEKNGLLRDEDYISPFSKP